MKSAFTRAVTTSMALLFSDLVQAQSVEVRPSLRTGTLNGPIRLDGLLDEPSWAAAEIMENFTTIEATQGGTPTGRTRVRVIASRQALYIEVICDDPNAAGISGDRAEFNVVPTGENLPRAFEVADGVNIPAGPYHWRR